VIFRSLPYKPIVGIFLHVLPIYEDQSECAIAIRHCKRERLPEVIRTSHTFDTSPSANKALRVLQRWQVCLILTAPTAYQDFPSAAKSNSITNIIKRAIELPR